MLLVVMLVNRLAWKNKLLMKNELAVKEITTMLLMFHLICLTFFRRGKDGLFY
jgi:hypothetical protein